MRLGRAMAVAVAALLMLLIPGIRPAHATVPGFHNIQGDTGWTDFNGDGMADACMIRDTVWFGCTLSTGTGFSYTPTDAGDPGYAAGRGWADVTGDGKADYCRVVGAGYLMLSCTASTGSGFEPPFISGSIDAGWDAGRAWADVTGDGRADYCRVVGSGSYSLRCEVSTGNGWNGAVQSGGLDPGWDAGRSWADVNGDGKADYCRVVGLVFQSVQCTLSTGSGWGQSFSSTPLDAGYNETRKWADFNGDGRADYCRVVSVIGGTAVRCTVSTGTGFGASFTSPAMNTGDNGAWADVNGDGRDDYCRDISWDYGACTLTTGSGTFGATLSKGGMSGVSSWPDFNGDGMADFCRRADWWTIACSISNGTSFGAIYTT
ncbi:VCBS repeat-containing protein [Streptosporangiaceae bacterium NEAU-GS5]|nr:VCBS repeat-containing protein [Streptosporangiaceae bacterium NEAU-GS5]